MVQPPNGGPAGCTAFLEARSLKEKTPFVLARLCVKGMIVFLVGLGRVVPER